MEALSERKIKTLPFPDLTNGEAKPKRTRIEVPNARLIQIDNLLSTQECQYLIKKGEELTFENIEHEYPKEYRNNERLLFTSDAFTSTIWNRMITLIANDMKGARPIGVANEGVWEPRSLNPVWRFCKYTKGGKFAPHFDGSHVNFPNERSIFTLIVYLNDDFKGGDTQFLESKESLTSFIKGDVDIEKVKMVKEVKPKQGSAIVFNHDVLHQGTAVTEGIKYILRADIVFRLIGSLESAESTMNNAKYKESTAYYLRSDKLEQLGDALASTESYLKGLQIEAPEASLSVTLSSKSLNSLNDLFDDILLHIFKFLCHEPYKEYFKLCLVCHRWERLLKHNRIWVEKCREKNPLTAILAPKIFKYGEANQNWLSRYQDASKAITQAAYYKAKSDRYEAQKKIYISKGLLNKWGWEVTKSREIEYRAAIAIDQEVEKKWADELFAHRTLVIHLDCDETTVKWADGADIVSKFPTTAVINSDYHHENINYPRCYGLEVRPALWRSLKYESIYDYDATVINFVSTGGLAHTQFLVGALNEIWSHMKTEPRRSPAAIIYPPTWTEEHLLKLLWSLFDRFDVPKVSFINAATASVLSSGQLSGIAIYVGNSITSIAPVIDCAVNFTFAQHYVVGDCNTTKNKPESPQWESIAVELRKVCVEAVKNGIVRIPQNIRDSLLENVTFHCSKWIAAMIPDIDQLIVSKLQEKYPQQIIRLQIVAPIEGYSALCLCPQFNSSKFCIDKEYYIEHFQAAANSLPLAPKMYLSSTTGEPTPIPTTQQLPSSHDDTVSAAELGFSSLNIVHQNHLNESDVWSKSTMDDFLKTPDGCSLAWQDDE